MLRWITQRFLNAETRQPRSLLYRMVPRQARTALRIVLKAAGDPVARIRVGEFRIEAPISHELPFVLQRWPQYSSNVARLARAVARKYPDLTIIDIGANIGDTVALILTQVKRPILCIEGHPRYLELLRRNIAVIQADVEIAATFLACRDERAQGSVNYHDGTAWLSTGSGGSAIEFRTLNRVLDDHPRFAASKLIKLDTDGFDAEIIISSLDRLRAIRPILFFEYDLFLIERRSQTQTDLLAQLAAAGYSRFMFWTNVGDYLATVEAGQHEILEDLDHHFRGRKSLAYCDVAAFTEADADVCVELRRSEIAYFGDLRK